LLSAREISCNKETTYSGQKFEDFSFTWINKMGENLWRLWSQFHAKCEGFTSTGPNTK
jgi:hypothetical protein